MARGINFLRIIFILALLKFQYLSGQNCNQRDLTLERRARGSDVVNAVIAKFDTTFTTARNALWPSSHVSTFMRRMAYVETLDGMEGDTFRSNYYGGIWGVNETNFHATRFLTGALLTTIRDNFCIMWDEVRWQNLTIPLYSALAVRLIWILNIRTTFPCNINNDVPAEHAILWNRCSYGILQGDTTIFTSRVQELENGAMGTECRIDTDVMFVLDSSGSINNADEQNWDRIVNYVYNFSDSLITGNEDSDQVGVITFSDTATTRIALTSNSAVLFDRISQLRGQYENGGTNTAEALRLLAQVEWRDLTSILRIAIVMTDGQSNDPSSTIQAANMLHNIDRTILVYVVAVTTNTREDELVEIATAPEYIDHLENFESFQLDAVRGRQRYQICFRASIDIGMNEAVYQDGFDRGRRARYRYNITQEGVSIRLCILSGSVILYASSVVPNPNVAYNSFMLEIHGRSCRDVFVPLESMSCNLCTAMMNTPMVNGRKRQAPIPEENEETVLYVSIESTEDNSSFTLNNTVGNVTEFTITCGNSPCGINTVCIDGPFTYFCNCLPGHERNSLLECEDINECEYAELNGCSGKANCSNTKGGYTCECLPGYNGDGYLCHAEDHTKLIAYIVGGTSGGLILILLLVIAIAQIYGRVYKYPRVKSRDTNELIKSEVTWVN